MSYKGAERMKRKIKVAAANLITGAVFFVLLLTISFVEIKYSAMVVCLLATFAAVQEGFFIRKTGEPIMSMWSL